MVFVVAIAHREEIDAFQFRERALARLSVTSLIGYERDHRGISWKEARRRMLKARVAFYEATRLCNVATYRHSRWYRAYLRARNAQGAN